MDWGQPTNPGVYKSQLYSGLVFELSPRMSAGLGDRVIQVAGYRSKFLQKISWNYSKVSSIYRAHVVGISMGGAIALQLTLEHPEIVENLVLINTFATLRPERPGVWLYYAGRFLMIHTLGLDVQSRVVARRIFPREDQESLRKILIGQICQANLKGYRATMRALARFEVTTRLGNIRQPTFVITGSKDTTVTPTNQRKLAQGIPHARQVFIEGGGHAIIAEQPELVNNYLVEFLRS